MDKFANFLARVRNLTRALVYALLSLVAVAVLHKWGVNVIVFGFDVTLIFPVSVFWYFKRNTEDWEKEVDTDSMDASVSAVRPDQNYYPVVPASDKWLPKEDNTGNDLSEETQAKLAKFTSSPAITATGTINSFVLPVAEDIEVGSVLNFDPDANLDPPELPPAELW